MSFDSPDNIILKKRNHATGDTREFLKNIQEANRVLAEREKFKEELKILSDDELDIIMEDLFITKSLTRNEKIDTLINDHINKLPKLIQKAKKINKIRNKVKKELMAIDDVKLTYIFYKFFNYIEFISREKKIDCLIKIPSSELLGEDGNLKPLYKINHKLDKYEFIGSSTPSEGKLYCIIDIFMGKYLLSDYLENSKRDFNLICEKLKVPQKFKTDDERIDFLTKKYSHDFLNREMNKLK